MSPPKLRSALTADNLEPARQPATHPGLALRLLGSPAVWRGPELLLRLNPTDAALLALLALDGPQTRQRLAGLLWPDSSGAGGAGNLRQRLFRLRRLAGMDLVLGDRVLALAPAVAHDLDNLAEGLAADPLHAAGDLLGPVDYADNAELAAQVAGLRARWRERLAQSLAGLAEQLAGQAKVAAALPYAERLVAEQPLAEHAHRRLMRLHYQRGDRAAALAAFDRCRRVLQAELGVAPGAETDALLQLLQRSLPTPAPSPAPKPVALLRPPQLVGREAVWALASQTLAAGRPVLLVGEAGLGKSRLLGDLASARAGWAVVAAQGGDGVLAYALLARCVSALVAQCGAPQPAWAAHELARIAPAASQSAKVGADVPGLAETNDVAGGPTADTFSALRLQQAFKQALDHWQAGGLAGLALDDLHFADEASLALLAPLVAATADGRMGWLLASRPLAQPGPALQAWLDPADSPCQLLPLAPLGLDGVQALLHSLGLPGIGADDWAAALLRHTGGHPLWLLQTLASVLDQGAAARPGQLQGLDTPADVQRLIDARLARLSEPARRLVRLAAVAGNDFSVDLAAAVLGVHALGLADAWQELQDQQVLRGPAFVHDLLRTAARRGVPDDIARVLHRQVAEALDGAPGGPAVPQACLASHWEAAGDAPRAARAFEAAAQQAHQRSAPLEELQALRAAARCHRLAGGQTADAEAPPVDAVGNPGGVDAQPGVHLAAAFDCDWQAVRLLLYNESADQALAAAQQLCRSAQGGRQRAAAQEAMARVLIDQMAPVAALAAARQAIAEADAVGDQRLALLAIQSAANALARQDQSEQALALLQTREDSLGVLSVDERLLWLSDLATALDYADRRSQAVGIFDRVIAEAEAGGRWAMAGEAWNNKAIALLYLARLAEGTQALQRSLACGARTGLPAGDMLISEMSVLGNLRDEGRFADYLLRAQAVPDELRASGHPGWAANAENDLGVAYAWLGRLDLARQALAPMPDDLPPWVCAARLLSQAHLAHDFGLQLSGPSAAQRVEEACALLKAAGAWGRRHVRLHLRLAQARELPLAQRLPEVAALRTEALATEQRMLAAQADVLYIPWLLQAGQAQAAARVAEALAQRCAATGPPPGVYRARLFWVLWQALQADHPGPAAVALRQAGAWIDQVAATQLPALFRQSFLHRNPVNVAVRSALSGLAPIG